MSYIPSSPKISKKKARIVFPSHRRRWYRYRVGYTAIQRPLKYVSYEPYITILLEDQEWSKMSWFCHSISLLTISMLVLRTWKRCWVGNPVPFLFRTCSMTSLTGWVDQWRVLADGCSLGDQSQVDVCNERNTTGCPNFLRQLSMPTQRMLNSPPTWAANTSPEMSMSDLQDFFPHSANIPAIFARTTIY